MGGPPARSAKTEAFQYDLTELKKAKFQLLCDKHRHSMIGPLKKQVLYYKTRGTLSAILAQL